MIINSHLTIDGYKICHRQSYPPGTELIFSNLTPRKTYRKEKPEGVVFFGLQYYIKRFLIDEWNNSFFSQPIEKVVDSYLRRLNNYLGPNKIGAQHLIDLHALGYLPLEIRALKEGSVVPYKVAPMVCWNTHKDFFWLTNYLETIWSVTIWPLSTTATTAKLFRDLAEKYAVLTTGKTDFVKFMNHNFSYRGCMGHEAATMIDAGWLTASVGSDTVPGIDFVEQYYNANSDKELVSCSVVALEHSTVCAYGKDNEKAALQHLITEVFPEGIVSFIADSYDYWKCITEYSTELKDVILARNGKLVFRPDSGDNVKIIVGENILDYTGDVKTLEEAIEWAKDGVVDNVGEETPHGKHGEDIVTTYFKFQNKAYKLVVEIDWNRHDKRFYYIETSCVKSYEEVVLTAEQKGTIECLWDIFGGTVNSLGFKELNPKVGCILGDGVTLDVQKAICEGLVAKGFATTNMVYGVGSYTLQFSVSRDSDGWAVKSTYCEVNSEARMIFKDPKTDTGGLKKSAKGLIAVYRDENGKFYQKDQVSWDEVKNCEYDLVYKDGKLLREQSLSEIRNSLYPNF